MRKGRSTWVAVLALSLVTGSLVALPSSPAQSAVGDSGSTSGAAVFATDGTGLYKDRIAWLSWGSHGDNIPVGRSVTNWHQTGETERVEVTCTLNSRTGTLRAYRPGDYGNDGLPRLYRRGATNTHVTGIGTVTQGDARELTMSCAARLATYATSGFTGSPTATVDVPLAGLVAADAESTNANEFNWVEPTTAGQGTWNVIDRFAASCGATYRLQRTADSNRLTFRASAECSGSNSYSGTAVAILSGATSIRVGLDGSGLAAMSFGYVLGADFGDAPASYGTSAAIVQPTWSGGTVGTSQTDISGGGSSFSLASIGAPAARLGPQAFPNAAPPFSTTANGDTGWTLPGASSLTADEDALSAALGTLTVTPGSTYTRSGVACAASAGSVRGWIDWNRNGVFDVPAEGSNTVACPSGGSVSLAFTVPFDTPAASVSTGDRSFLRLQFSADANRLDSPTTTQLRGEVEDWTFLLRTQRLRVTKTANQSMMPGAGGVVTYSVTVTNVGNVAYTSGSPARLYDETSQVVDDATRSAVTRTPTSANAPTVLNNRITWQGALAVGASVTLNYTMTARPDAQVGDRVMSNIARVSNTAIAAGTAITCEPGSADEAAQYCARVDLYRVGLDVTKRAYLRSDTGFTSPIANASALTPGTQVTWRYEVRNTGSIALTDVVLSDVATDSKIDKDGTVTSTTSPTITCSGLTPGTSVTIPTLAASTSRFCVAEGVIGGT